MCFAHKSGKKFLYGFTLIEIMVVMVVIAIASAVIVIKVGGFYLSNQRADVFSKEMAAFIKLARDKAVFSLITIQLNISSQDYTFLKFDEKSRTAKPVNVNSTDFFWSKHNIPDTIIINYKAETPNNNSLSSNSSPPIFFFPSGEITPFVMSIHANNSSKVYTIRVTHTGSVSLGT